MCKLSNSHESNEAKKKNLEEKKKARKRHMLNITEAKHSVLFHSITNVVLMMIK